MGTTLNPLCNAGPDDNGLGPRFPASTGAGMLRQLREAGAKRFGFLRPKKQAKTINKEAQGKTNVGKKAKLKTSRKPENLRTGKKKKLGAFGEAYEAPAGNTGKGVRVAESRRTFESRMGRFNKAVEKAPPGREDQVKKLKKNPNIDNPYAVAWSQYNS